MQTRIYVVLNKADQSRRLVEAATAAQAVRHCVQNVYEAKVAGSKEVASLMREGFQLEVASGKAPKGEAAEAAETEAPETE